MIPARNSHPAKSENGFTLLELLIAVTLVAMMAVGLWAVFSVSIRSWSRGTEFIDANQHHRSIMDLARKQMASAYGLIASPDPQQGLIPRVIFQGTENSVRFISLNSLRFQESPGLTYVIYEIEQDSNGAYSLVEKEARYLGQLSEQEITASQAEPITIFGNLSSCIFEYFDSENNEAAWVRNWDGETLRRLPEAISVTMISQDAKGNSLNRHLVVPIHAEAIDHRVNLINPFGNRRAVMQ